MVNGNKGMVRALSMDARWDRFDDGRYLNPDIQTSEHCKNFFFSFRYQLITLRTAPDAMYITVPIGPNVNRLKTRQREKTSLNGRREKTLQREKTR
jgi:hypothetical protein